MVGESKVTTTNQALSGWLLVHTAAGKTLKRIHKNSPPFTVNTAEAYPGPGLPGKISWGDKSIPGSSRTIAVIMAEFHMEDPMHVYYCVHSLMAFLEKSLSPDRDHFLSDGLVEGILWEPLAGLYPTPRVADLPDSEQTEEYFE